MQHVSFRGKISGSHGGEYEVKGLLGCSSHVVREWTDVSEMRTSSIIRAMNVLLMEAVQLGDDELATTRNA
jgi:hypothetical protein